MYKIKIKLMQLNNYWETGTRKHSIVRAKVTFEKSVETLPYTTTEELLSKPRFG